MNYKKLVSLCAALTLFVAAAALAAGAEVPPAAKAEESAAARPLVTVVTYPEQYLITYKVTDEQGIMTTYTKGRDANGNVYYQDPSEETLYLYQDSGYTAYTFDHGDTPIGDFTVTYGEKYVDRATQPIAEYAEKASTPFLRSAVYCGQETLLERPAARYQKDVSFLILTQSYAFSQDAETGLCLSWQPETRIGGIVSGEDDTSFVCYRFETENIVLPKLNLIPKR